MGKLIIDWLFQYVQQLLIIRDKLKKSTLIKEVALGEALTGNYLIEGALLLALIA